MIHYFVLALFASAPQEPLAAGTDVAKLVDKGYDLWLRCVDTRAREWATLNAEPADVVARGAVADCSRVEPSMQKLLTHQLIMGDVAATKASDLAREFVARHRDRLREGAIATVLEVRAAAKQ